MSDGFTHWFKYGFMRLPVLASEHGRDIDNVLMYIHWLMFGLLIGWSAFFLYTLMRFRRARQPRADYHGVRSHFSNYLEGGVALIEVLLLVGFSVPLWAKVVGSPPAESEATVIRVMGRQFNWMAHYAGTDGVMGRQNPTLSSATDPFGVDRAEDPAALDDVVVQGTIVVPVDRPVIAHVTSLDVIHSFAIGAMRVCQDAIPGLSIPTWFTPTKPGDYKITCAQLCGNSHYGMFGTLRVLPQQEYDQWLAEESAKASAPAAQAVDYE